MTERRWIFSPHPQSAWLDLQESADGGPPLLDGGPPETGDGVVDAAVTIAVEPTSRPQDILAPALDRPVSSIDRGRC
jgi:hypothetical protein